MIQKELHIHDYIQVILRRRWIIITFFSTLLVTVFIGSIKQKPIYRATATIMIEKVSPKVVLFQEVTPMGTSDYQAYKDYYETQYKLLTSRALLTKVMDSLGLRDDFSYKKEDPVARFSGIIKVNPLKNSQLVEVSVEHNNPELAAKIANKITDEYLIQNLERSVSASQDAAVWLSKKISEQRQKIMESELSLQEYRLKHDINVLPQLTGESAIEDVKAEYARLQAQLDNYSQRYTDEHPKVVELKAQIKSLKNKIQGLEDIGIGDKSMEYMVLEREVQTNRQMYEMLLTRLKETNLSSSLTVNNISIVDRAETPKKPFKPNLKLNMLLAVVSGLVMGTGLAFFVEYLDTTIKSPEDVKEILQAHPLGVIPSLMGEDELRKDKIMHFEPSSPAAEAYRSIRTDILKSSSGGQPIKTLLITSAEPQAGKTMTVSNLGIALSHQGNKVLLVDCDLRRPQLHKVFNLERDTGMSEYLSDGTKIDSIIKDTEIDNLKVVTSGKLPSNPSEIIGSGKLDEFIRDSKDFFDFIIFDSAPITSITDSAILADKVDAALQVVRSGKAFIPLAVRTKELLDKAKAKTLGVILNDLDMYRGDYYYYRYYHYYGEEDGRRRRAHKQSSWESKQKAGELAKKLSETWVSIKTDSNRLALLIKDKFNRRKNNNPREERDKKVG